MDGVILSNARPFATDRPHFIAIFPHGTNGHELSHSGCPLLGVERVGNLYRSLVNLLPRRDQGINRGIVLNAVHGATPWSGHFPAMGPDHDSEKLQQPQFGQFAPQLWRQRRKRQTRPLGQFGNRAASRGSWRNVVLIWQGGVAV